VLTDEPALLQLSRLALAACVGRQPPFFVSRVTLGALLEDCGEERPPVFMQRQRLKNGVDAIAPLGINKGEPPPGPESGDAKGGVYRVPQGTGLDADAAAPQLGLAEEFLLDVGQHEFVRRHRELFLAPQLVKNSDIDQIRLVKDASGADHVGDASRREGPPRVSDKYDLVGLFPEFSRVLKVVADEAIRLDNFLVKS